MPVNGDDLWAEFDTLPRVALGSWPTPVESWPQLLSEGGPALYIKRDDVSGTTYGGNKVRKLEYLLARAKAIGAKTVMTTGYAGSNHALATAVYARSLGLQPISLLLPQLNAPYVRANLDHGHAVGAELVLCRNVPLLLMAGLKRWLRGRVAVIPPGGSSPLGNLGYVRAAFELRAQIAAGLCPEPDRIYLPLGSMGTAAGLAVGLLAAGLRSRIVAVRVTESRYGSAIALRRLIRQTQRYLARRLHGWRAKGSEPEVTVRDSFFGGQYAAVTPAAADAVARAAAAGVVVETTYSGKALAALLADAVAADGGESWLFWHTYNGRPLPDSGGDYRLLPAAFYGYFERPDGLIP